MGSLPFDATMSVWFSLACVKARIRWPDQDERCGKRRKLQLVRKSRPRLRHWSHATTPLDLRGPLLLLPGSADDTPGSSELRASSGSRAGYDRGTTEAV